VDAVVVLGTQVNGGEGAVVKLRGQCSIATQQRARAVVVALGLEDLVALNAAQLTHRAVHRAHPAGIRQRAGAGLQGPGEKFVEARVAFNARIGGFGHVHAVTRHEAADDGGGDAPGACPGHPACKHGKRPLGQQVLRQHRQAIRHRALSKGNAKILAATQYQPWQPPCLKRST
jgi:hypothetical protein